MSKIVLTFGLIAGAILSAMMLATLPLQDRIGFEAGAVIGYTTMVLAFLMVFFGIRAYRDGPAGGSVGFGRACAVGLAITAVASCCYVATWELIFWRLAPDFADKYAAHAIDKARRAGASEARLAAVRQEMSDFQQLYRNPLANVAITFVEPLPVGVVFTLVSAAVLCRKRRSAGGVPA